MYSLKKVIKFFLLFLLGGLIGYLFTFILKIDIVFVNQHPIWTIVSIVVVIFLGAEISIQILEKYIQTDYYILNKQTNPFVVGISSGFVLPLVIEMIAR